LRLTSVVACSSTKTLSSTQSRCLYVRRLSTSKSTSRLYTQQTLCTVFKCIVLKLVLFWLYSTS